MQRLVVAFLLVAVVVALGFALISVFRRASTAPGDAVSTVSPMQRISFFLLSALIVYVAVAGAN